MENKKVIYLFASIFSLVFAMVYYFLFSSLVSPNKQQNVLYMNQVGLYKSQENANKVIEKLKEQGIPAYILAKEDVLAVVCSLSDQEQETKQQQEKLASLGYSYIQKSVPIVNANIASKLQEKDYATVLEMIKNESQGNDNKGEA